MPEEKIEHLLPNLRRVELGLAAATAVISAAMAAGYVIRKNRQVEPRILLPEFFAAQRTNKNTPPTKIEMAIIEVAVQLERKAARMDREELLGLTKATGFNKNITDRAIGYLADNGLADVESVGKERRYGRTALLAEIAKPENAEDYQVFHSRLTELRQVEAEQPSDSL